MDYRNYLCITYGEGVPEDDPGDILTAGRAGQRPLVRPVVPQHRVWK